MNILGIQIVGIAFGIIFIYLTFLSKKKGEINSTESIFWSVVWLALIFVSIFPGMLSILVKDVFNISRTLDFIIIMSFLLMFGIIFYMFSLTRKTNLKVEELVRKLAVKEIKKKK